MIDSYGYVGEYASLAIVAGILIGRFSESFFGIGLAFGIDAVTFAVSAVTLWLMRGVGQLSGSAGASDQEGIWAAIMAGLKYVWDDQALRLIFLVIAAINFLFVGPVLVGAPVLADQRLPEGATNERAFELYKDRVKIGFDPTEGIVKMEVVAASPEEAEQARERFQALRGSN